MQKVESSPLLTRVPESVPVTMPVTIPVRASMEPAELKESTADLTSNMPLAAEAQLPRKPDLSTSNKGSLHSKEVVEVKEVVQVATAGTKSSSIWLLSIFTVCLIASSALAAYCRQGSAAYSPKNLNLKEPFLAKSLRGFDSFDNSKLQNTTYLELSDRAHAMTSADELKGTEDKNFQNTLKAAQDPSSFVNLSPESIQALAIAISEEKGKALQREVDQVISASEFLAKEVEDTALKIETLQRTILIPFGSRVQTTVAIQSSRNTEIDPAPVGYPGRIIPDPAPSRFRSNSTDIQSGNLIDSLFDSLSRDLAQFQNTSTIIKNVQNICESLFKMSNIETSSSTVTKACSVNLPLSDTLVGYLLSPTVRRYIKPDFLRTFSSRDYRAPTLPKPSTLVEFDQLITKIEKTNDAYCSDLKSKIESQLQQVEQIIATTQSIQNDPPSKQFYLNQVELMRKSLLTSVEHYNEQFNLNFESKRPLLENGMRLVDESTRIQKEINDLVAPSRIGKATWEEHFGPITTRNPDYTLEPPLDLGHYYFLEYIYQDIDGHSVQRKELYDLFLMPKEVQSSELTLGNIKSLFASISKRDPVDLVFDQKISQNFGISSYDLLDLQASEYSWAYISKDPQPRATTTSQTSFPIGLLLCRMLIDYMQGKPLSSYPVILSQLNSPNYGRTMVYANVFPRGIYVSSTNLMALPAKTYEYVVAG